MTPRQPAPRAARGFTLLEAIVAMTIFSMCALALFGWQSGSLRALDRIEARATRAEQVRLAMAALANVNPMTELKGERVVGDERVRWQATPVEPVRTGKTQVGLPSLFDVGLYDLAVVVQRGDAAGEAGVTTFHVRLVGYKQVRQTGFAE
jgi:general secretion pathway protein I